MQTKYPTGRQCITPPLFLLFLSIARNLARNIVGLRIPTEATQCEINRGQTNRTTKLSGEKAKARPSSDLILTSYFKTPLSVLTVS